MSTTDPRERLAGIKARAEAATYLGGDTQDVADDTLALVAAVEAVLALADGPDHHLVLSDGPERTEARMDGSAPYGLRYTGEVGSFALVYQRPEQADRLRLGLAAQPHVSASRIRAAIADLRRATTGGNPVTEDATARARAEAEALGWCTDQSCVQRIPHGHVGPYAVAWPTWETAKAQHAQDAASGQTPGNGPVSDAGTRSAQGHRGGSESGSDAAGRADRWVGAVVTSGEELDALPDGSAIGLVRRGEFRAFRKSGERWEDERGVHFDEDWLPVRLLYVGEWQGDE